MVIDCMWLKCETERSLNFFKRGAVASHYVARYSYHAPKKESENVGLEHACLTRWVRDQVQRWDEVTPGEPHLI